MEMEPQGFLHNKLDVKILILFILARIDAPLSAQELYEVAYQDESLNYFTLAESLPELAASGHLQTDAEGRYSITELGRTQGAQVEDSLAVPVVQKVSAAIAETQARLLRESNIQSRAARDQAGNWAAELRYLDDGKPMMTLSLMAPNETVARSMAENLRKQADSLLQHSMEAAIASNGKQGG